jgi:hypothetical protein
MQHPTLETINKKIEEVVTQYRENPSDELYQKWIDLLKEYSKTSQSLKPSARI